MIESPHSVLAPARRCLNGISEIRGFFRTNTTPIYFFGPTAFNLLGIDRWVRNFSYVACCSSTPRQSKSAQSSGTRWSFRPTRCADDWTPRS
jgi:hypothetical protein